MSFFEKYLSKKLDFADEILNFEYLLNERQNIFDSIYSVVEENFKSWHYRRTAVALKTFMKQSGLSDIICKAQNRRVPITLEELLDYIEFVNSIIYGFFPEIKSKNLNVSHIVKNTNIILSTINYELIWVNDNPNPDDKYAKCVEKDVKVRQAAEIVEDENLAERIFMYNHHSLKGNIFEKAIILSRLYMQYEGMEQNFKANNLKNLFSSVSTLSDKMNVRHRPSKKEELIISGFMEEEIEKIYDQMFKEYLTAIILDDFLKNRGFLDEVKNKFI